MERHLRSNKLSRRLPSYTQLLLCCPLKAHAILQDSDHKLPHGTVEALQFHLNDGRPVSSSAPASEHSSMTAWRTERQAMLNLIEQYGEASSLPHAAKNGIDSILCKLLESSEMQ